jgi:hypothetical protein
VLLDFVLLWEERHKKNEGKVGLCCGWERVVGETQPKQRPLYFFLRCVLELPFFLSKGKGEGEEAAAAKAAKHHSSAGERVNKYYYIHHSFRQHIQLLLQQQQSFTIASSFSIVVVVVLNNC